MVGQTFYEPIVRGGLKRNRTKGMSGVVRLTIQKNKRSVYISFDKQEYKKYFGEAQFLELTSPSLNNGKIYFIPCDEDNPEGFRVRRLDSERNRTVSLLATFYDDDMSLIAKVDGKVFRGLQNYGGYYYIDINERG